MLRSPGKLLLLLAASLCVLSTNAVTGSSTAAAVVVRRLEQEEEEDSNEDDANNNNNNNGAYYYTLLQQGACFQSKIEEDDDSDGNSYFYNGAYRAQYNRYIQFFSCSSSGSNGVYSSGGSNEDDGEVCNYDAPYVIDLDDYLGAITDYFVNMCDVCANNCRRFLEDEEGEDGDEDEEEEEPMQVDCYSCADDCELVWENSDETNYLECQYSLDDENGISYYSAPLCKEGSVVIGHFYDDECTVKAGLEFDADMDYNVFRTMESISVDCSSGYCDDLFEEATYCANDAAEDGDDEDNKLCKAAVKAGQVQTYRKKPWYKKLPVKAVLFTLLFLAIVFAGLSYVYYVRHRRSQEATEMPMSALDGESPTSYGQMT